MTTGSRSVPISHDAGPLGSVLELNRALALAERPDEIARISLEVAARTLGVDGAAVALRDGDEIVTYAQQGYDATKHGRMSLGANVPVAVAIREGKPLFFADHAATLAAFPHVAWQPGFEARAVLPLSAGAAAWGAIALSWRERREPSPDWTTVLETFAAAIAQSLRRARETQSANESRAELDDFVNTSSIGIHFVAADGTILWANAADHELLGYAREEFVGHNIAEFHADQDNLGKILTCLLNGERIVNRPATLRHKDGSLRHVLIDSSGRFVEGKFAHTRCFTRDVTGLWEQAERHDALLRAQDAMGDAILLLEDARIVWVNEATTRLMGYSAEELTSRSFDRSVLAPPEDLATIQERAQARRAGQASDRYLTRLIRRDGKLLRVEVSYCIVNERQRVAIVRDVTPRETALTRLTGIIQAAPVQIVVLDRNGIIETINNTPTGRSLENVPGKSIYEVTPPEYLPQVEPRVRAALDQVKPGEYELQVAHPAGPKWMHVRVTPLLEGGEPNGAIIISADVTSLKRAESALTEQRDLYEGLLRAQSDLDEGMILAWEGRLAYANDAFLRMLGLTREEIARPGFDVRQRLAPDVRDEAMRLLDGRDPATPLHYETAYVRPDGRRVEVEVASVGVNHKGGFQRLAIFRDVTRQREAETRARKRNAFLTDATLRLLERTLHPDATLELVADLATEYLGDAASVDVFGTEAQTRRVVISHRDPAEQAFAREYVARHAPSRLIQQMAAQLPAGEIRVANHLDHARVAQAMGDDPDAFLSRRLGIRHSMLIPLRGRSGLVGVLGLSRVSGQPFDEEDAFVAKSLATRAVLAYENAILHDETKKLEAAWRSLYERYERLIQMAPAQILTINDAGPIVSLNRTLRGDEPSAHVGRDAWRDLSADERPRIQAVIREAIATRTPAGYETEAVLPSGERQWVQVRVGPVELDDGPGAVLVITNIDEKKRVEGELAHMRAILIQGEKLSALGSLVSGVAHELRTPLTFLSNNAFLLKRRLDDATRRGDMTPQARQAADAFLAEITTGVDRINQLVEDLRRYTKARQDASTTRIALNDAIGDAVELFRATNRAAHRLEGALGRTELVNVNVGAIQQIVLNLLQNAADASPLGGIIRITTRDVGDRVVLEVEDQGAGIPKQVLDRMYEPLFTTKREGSGLGLSIVKRICDEHKATIECESEPGHGARFVVSFPRA